MNELQMWLVGDASRPEWQDVRRALPRGTSLRCMNSVDKAVDALQASWHSPDLIVLVQSRPGELSNRDVLKLRSADPLVRLVVVVDSWCDRATEAGSSLDGTMRCEWHQWPFWLSAEVSRLRSGRLSQWMAPLTATDDERLLEDMSPEPPLCEGLALIATRHRDSYVYLADACAAIGMSSLWYRPGERWVTRRATVAIWDVREWTSEEQNALVRFVDTSRLPTIAVLPYPRSAIRSAMLQAGVCTMLAKPLRISDLWRALDEAARGAERPWKPRVVRKANADGRPEASSTRRN